MRHIRTKEIRLFDLKNDHSEKQDLAQKLPEKVAEIEKILDAYLDKIDAESLDAVYEARFEQLDKFEAQSVIQYERNVKHLDVVVDAEKINFFEDKLEKDKLRFADNREEVRRNMMSTDW